jgi:hypothetical protein
MHRQFPRWPIGASYRTQRGASGPSATYVANITEQDIFVSIAVSDLILRNAIYTYIECSAIFATLVAHGPLALDRVLSLAPIGHRGNCRWFQSREAA